MNEFIDKIDVLMVVDSIFYQYLPTVYEAQVMSAVVMISDIENFGIMYWRG